MLHAIALFVSRLLWPPIGCMENNDFLTNAHFFTCSMQTTGNPGNLVATKAIRRRYLVQKPLCVRLHPATASKPKASNKEIQIHPVLAITNWSFDLCD